MKLADFARLSYVRPDEVPHWDKLDFNLLLYTDELIGRLKRKPRYVSTWRSTAENEKVGAKGGSHAGLHPQGKALDLFFEGVNIGTVYNTAIAQGTWGGIGLYYPEGTIHLDTGARRNPSVVDTWSRIGGVGQPYVAAGLAIDKFIAAGKWLVGAVGKVVSKTGWEIPALLLLLAVALKFRR